MRGLFTAQVQALGDAVQRRHHEARSNAAQCVAMASSRVQTAKRKGKSPSVDDLILVSMQANRIYRWGELLTLTGLPRKSFGVALMRLVGRRLVDKTLEPDEAVYSLPG